MNRQDKFQGPADPSRQCMSGPYMEMGARRLSPMIEKYRNELGNTLLELGPNKHPLITPESYGGRIVYIEISAPCVGFLRERFRNTVTVLTFDLNQAWNGDENCLKRELMTALDSSGEFRCSSIILSQVLNYVDFRLVLRACGEVVASGALLFVNNIMNHGANRLFHPRRPKDMADFLAAAAEIGFDLVETLTEPARVADPTKTRDLAVLRSRSRFR